MASRPKGKALAGSPGSSRSATQRSKGKKQGAKNRSRLAEQNSARDDTSGNRSDAVDAAESLPWSAVDLPGEAAAMAGETDADFYEGLDVNDDDFMGLTELEGVQVVKDASGGVRFVRQTVSGKGKQKEQGTVEPDQVRLRKTKRRKDALEEDEDDTEELQGVTGADDVDLPPIDFDSEDEEEGDLGEHHGILRKEKAKSKADSDVAADFTLLKSDEGVDQRTWTNSELSKHLPAWKKLPCRFHSRLYTALEAMSFKKPTEIQAASLPLSASPDGDLRDVIGIAQTGSGKTLAYALPILHWIASNSQEDRQMQLIEQVNTSGDHGTLRIAGLILAPTRELALQVTKHIQAIIDASSSSSTRRWASVVAVTGGISEEKQRRLLHSHHNRGADIIVATPGRLWDLCKSDDNLTRRIKASRFLVIDEADRMIETGHFAEMESILGLVRRADGQDDESMPTAGFRGGARDLQTLVFSATLSKELQHNLKRNKKSNKRRHGQGSSLDDLMDLIDFRDDDPAIVDLSTATRIASRVVEIKAECLAKDKDLYLYYFLLRYPGRTLVFVNSIDGIRRLQPLLANLGTSVHPLHSQLQQKQRLKNLDRFRASQLPTVQSSAVLLATDVAARGLDIPAVDHVVHFQLPRSTDTYVHRSGRTARGGHTGVSLALVDPSEKRLWRDLNRNLKRDDSLPTMPVEYSFLPLLRERIELAREIDRKTHAQNKEAHDDAWLRKLASEADMDLSEDESSVHEGGKAGKSADGRRNVAGLRAQLASLLRQPLRAHGISFKYLTGGSREFLDGILADTQHTTMIGVQQSTVQSDVTKHETAKGDVAPVNNAKRKRGL